MQGCVSVNGRVVTEPSAEIDPSRDSVILRNQKIFLKEKVVALLNKPAGVTTTLSDRHADKTVMELLPSSFGHLFPVGRLDKESRGLLILTNDGDLAHRLSHPSFEVAKVYRVLLDRPLAEKDKAALERGIVLEGGRTVPCQIRKTAGLQIEIIVHEGKKRQIRLMFASRGYEVKDLVRTQQGSLRLGNLETGRWRLLTERELSELRRSAGLG
jgi:pseudouridine synthase